MDHLITFLFIGISTFVITNIDDLLLLTIYFGRTDIKRSEIILGQYIGVFALVALSLSGMLLDFILSPPWIGLLGLIPIFLGCKGLFQLFKRSSENSAHSQSLQTGFLNIALITIANGGDNLGVYTPLFASSSPQIITLYLLIFFIMVAAWCIFAFYLVKLPLIRKAVKSWGEWILPFFLIALGCYILMESGSFSLIQRPVKLF